MSSKRILILTASIGSGHIKAADAVADELRRQMPDAKIKTIDFMDRRISIIHWLMKQIYLIMLALIPNIYDLLYKAAGAASSGPVAQNAFAVVMYPVMRRLVKKHRPDAILCTHPFPEGAAALYKRWTGAPYWLAVVMTDYSLHQIWLYHGVDAYFMALPSMAAGMEQHGFPKERLHVTGIPVAMSLMDLPDKASMREQLGLPVDRPVVLLMGGGLGLGGIDTTLKELEQLETSLVLLVVAGRNERLGERAQAFAAHSRHEIRVWGYTEQAHELMRAADLIITKPGALTMSEAFVLGLPLLLHDPIPGPETDNAIYATRHGAAVWLHPHEKIAPAVRHMLADGVLPGMTEQARHRARPRAAEEIAHTLLASLSEMGDGQL